MNYFNLKLIYNYLSILLVFSLLLSTFNFTFAQTSPPIEPLTPHHLGSSFRGLQVANDQSIWVSGSKGVVGISTNGGLSWKWQQVPGYEKRDFRDIAAFDSANAIIMAVAEPAVILKTSNGGQSWQLVFSDTTPGMFLDAMHFINPTNGIVVGDPINGKAFIAYTIDGGEHWNPFSDSVEQNRLSLDSGEAFFASSGANIQLMNSNKPFEFFMVSGGQHSRLIGVGFPFNQNIPFSSLGTTKGANALAMKNKKKGVIVGGDFSNDQSAFQTCWLVNTTSSNPFRQPLQPTFGYRSSVIWVNNKLLLACGTSGIDISADEGNHWKNISTSGFHVAATHKKSKWIFLAGSNGRLARIPKSLLF